MRVAGILRGPGFDSRRLHSAPRSFAPGGLVFFFLGGQGPPSSQRRSRLLLTPTRRQKIRRSLVARGGFPRLVTPRPLASRALVCGFGRRLRQQARVDFKRLQSKPVLLSGAFNPTASCFQALSIQPRFFKRLQSKRALVSNTGAWRPQHSTAPLGRMPQAKFVLTSSAKNSPAGGLPMPKGTASTPS